MEKNKKQNQTYIPELHNDELDEYLSNVEFLDSLGESGNVGFTGSEFSFEIE